MKRIFIFLLFLVGLLALDGCSEKEYAIYNSIEDTEDGIYNYCPSIYVEDGVYHVYYCSNKVNRNITDYIAYREGTRKNDLFSWSEKQLVMAPTPRTWDERHTCDPSVIAGEFNYMGQKYNYLMAYLGCITSNNQENSVGIAVASDPEGPWVKVDSINPIAEYKRNMDVDQTIFQWGYGQPSLVSFDKAGVVLLFYTEGVPTHTGTVVEKWDLKDLENPKLLDKAKVTNSGLADMNGKADFLNNADFGYDPVKKRLYAISDWHPWPQERDIPNNIVEAGRISYIECGDKGLDILFDNDGVEWVTPFIINEEKTGFPRNHNLGIVTDKYGWLPKSKSIEFAYSVSEKGHNALWSYRIYFGEYFIR